MFSVNIKQTEFNNLEIKDDQYERNDFKVQTVTFYYLPNKKNKMKILLIDQFKLSIEEQKMAKDLSVVINKANIQIGFDKLESIADFVFRIVNFFTMMKVESARKFCMKVFNSEEVTVDQTVANELLNNSKLKIDLNSIQIKINFDFKYDLVLRVEAVEKNPYFKYK